MVGRRTRRVEGEYTDWRKVSDGGVESEMVCSNRCKARGPKDRWDERKEGMKGSQLV